MIRKRILSFFACILVLSMLVACGGGLETVSSSDAQAEDPVGAESSVAGSGQVVEDVAANAGADVALEPSEDHDDAEDYIWDSSQVVGIVLDGDSITVEGDGVAVVGSTATILSAGTYSISGSLADGQVIVDTEDQEIVRLILDGVEISSSTSAPIEIAQAEETMIVLAENTENRISDGESYQFEDADEDEPNAAIFSKGDLTICGNGSLTVDSNYNDGIASKDGLIIASGTITVDAADDGIRGKDYLVINDGTITVTAQGDGLKSDNEEDATTGTISIETGVLNITSGRDAIQAQRDVLITDGEFNLSSGGGSSSRIEESTSAKGIKAGVHLQIDGGTFAIDSADDAIHSNGSLIINAGTFTISCGDDAMHADSTMEVNGGEIRVTDSFEGLESAVITINSGELHIVARDDGLNVAGGNDGSGFNRGPGLAGSVPQGAGPGVVGGFAQGGRPAPAGEPGQDAFTYSGDYYLYINGGYIAIEAAGDGIDVNGAIEMTDGVVLVNGPTENMNGALDYDASFNISGGFLIAVGSAGMAQAPGGSSTQNSVLLNFGSTLRAGTLLHIQAIDGDDILTFMPTKQYQSVALSSPALTQGSTYEVYTGGSSTGTVNDGLYQDGTCRSGSQYTHFTISGVVTRIGANLR